MVLLEDDDAGALGGHFQPLWRRGLLGCEGLGTDKHDAGLGRQSREVGHLGEVDAPGRQPRLDAARRVEDQQILLRQAGSGRVARIDDHQRLDVAKDLLAAAAGGEH